ncbi:ectoine synthase [Paraburkholderia bonniea]|uniref:ectoine synthase n=1 Tax=Paraburkholderia bonniea TaxID=2152891 RepID=UPI001291DA3C|nr:ectoine synthase [Paraburkholderia bonniea]WJF91651.1 ectoine synthase [Paraburkholderia bonniea]WJF94969.1 ectoine synthase [Paraburkholderia bonniea]
MIVRTVQETTGTSRHASGPGWDSKRLIVAADNVGYSVHDTTVAEGAEQILEYKHHIEANYCFAGEGEVVDVATGKTYPLRPGSIYVLDKHDRHILRALKGDLRLVCVFNPPLAGDETHEDDGSYAPIGGVGVD